MTSSDFENEVVALALAYLTAKKNKKRRRPKFHVNPYLRLRSAKGRFSSDVRKHIKYWLQILLSII